MALIRVETLIHAPRQRCFDLARSVDAHTASTARTGERAVAGVTSGLMGLGDSVTWEARHLGVKQRLTARITALDAPSFFEDRMVHGAFAWFTHRHEFRDEQGSTRMIDLFEYAAPLGPLGRIAEVAFLTRYMRRFLVERAAFLKRAAEQADRA